MRPEWREGGPPEGARWGGPPWARGRHDGGAPWPGHGGVPWPGFVLVLALVQVVGTVGAAHGQPGRRPLDPLGVALLLAGPVLLVVLRRQPVARVLAVCAVTAAYLVVGYPWGPVVLSAVVVLVGAVASGRRVLAWASAAALLGVVVGVDAVRGDLPVVPALAACAWTVVVLLAGESVRYRRERWAEASRTWAARREQQAAEEARASAERERAAVEERLRVAQDLHDVVGHSLSLISVQAGVALHLLDDHPDQARPALTAIRQASRDALDEVRGVLEVLRADGSGAEPGAAPRAPARDATAPDLSRLDDLLDGARAAGLDVRLTVVGDRRPLPRAVEGTAYRVVQEALTNVARHASQATVVDVVLTYGDALDVAVRDDGGGTAGPEGSGLRGMRDRVALLGGTLETGPLPDKGFGVHALIPAGEGQ